MKAKRILSLILSICMMFTIASFPAMASTGTTEDGFEYTVSGYYATITKYNGSASVVEIPAEIEGARVNAIGEDAFKNCTSLVEIIIPLAGTIGDNAFSGCTSLRDVYYQGTNFNWVTVGEGNECLTNATIHHHEMEGGMGGPGFDMHEMDRGYTDNCDEECNICKYRREAPHTYDGDADLVCDGCGNVRETPVATFDYTIENDEVTITEYTGNATEVVIPSTIEGYPVTKIGGGAFGECEDVVSVTVPSGVKSIGSCAFYFCTSLQTVELSEGLKVIDESAFSDCSNLTSITLPEGLTSLGDYAFGYCPKLVSVDLPKTVTSIGDYAFNGCYKLSTVYYGGTETQKSAITVGTQNEYLLNATWHCTSVETPITDFEYTISNGEVTIDRYIGDATEVVIPSTIEGYPVTAIGYNAFYCCTSLTSITIPDSVTSIGREAFYYCPSLTSIIIPDSVTSIGEHAFFSCTSLASVIIPDSVTSIGEYAFFSCTSLIEINVDANNQYYSSVDGVLFNKHKTSLLQYPTSKTATTYTIPNSVTSICDYAFTGTSITDVYYNGTMAQKVEIEIGPNNDILNAIWHYTSSANPTTDFKYTIEKNKVTIDKYIGTATEVVIPSVIEGYPVTAIYDWAFEDCDFVTSVVIPDSIISIGFRAFTGCVSLTSIYIPRSIEYLSDESFVGCSSLVSINVNSYNADYSSENGVLFNKQKTKLVCYPSGRSNAAYSIPEGVESIGDYAFYGCEYLYFVTFPNTVTTICEHAFTCCSVLKSITIPESVTYIGYGAFASCVSLDNIKLPTNLTTISGSTFYNCKSLTSISLPKNLIAIYGSAFNSSGLTSINIPEGTEYIGSSAFESCGLTYINIPEGVKYIGEDAFSGCESLVSVKIPESAAQIYKGTFSGCTSLTSVVMPKNTGKITNYMFSGCTALSSITIPDGVSAIGDCAFYGCSSLTSVTIPDSVTLIGSWAFYDCDSLAKINYTGREEQKQLILIEDYNDFLLEADWQCYLVSNPAKDFLYAINDEETTIIEYVGAATKVVIPYSVDGYPVTRIATGAFVGSNVVSVNIPKSVKEIGNSAFSGCKSLTSIVIPEGVEIIEKGAFWACNALVSVHLPMTITTIGNRAFYACNSLENVYYSATETQKSIIDIGVGNANLIYADWHYNTPTPKHWSSASLLLSREDYTGRIDKYKGNETKVVIPSSYMYSGTEKYTITAIGESAFEDCDFIKAVVLSEDTKAIYYDAFKGCTSLAYIYIPNSVTEIYNGAFSGCASLRSIVLPDSLNSITPFSFYCCSSLSKITIPNSVTYIERGAFMGCASLADVYYEGTKSERDAIKIDIDNEALVNATWHYFDSDAYFAYAIENNEVIITGYAGTDTELEIPTEVDGYPVTAIADYAFYKNTNLVSVVLPHTLKSIGAYAFYGCTSLNGDIQASNWSASSTTSVPLTIPGSVKTIGEYAFADCVALDAVVLGASVEEIGNYAFTNCTSLTSVSIPRSIKTIGNSVFKDCESLAEVKYEGSAVDKDNIAFGDGNDILEDNWQNTLPYVSGDTNGDGKVNNKDMGLLRQHLNGWDVTLDLLAADVNRDGKVNNKDFGILRQYLNGWDAVLK